MPPAPFTSGAAGTTGAPFLKIPVAAREEAMGGVYAASSRGAEALFLNPAGILPEKQEDPGSEASLGFQHLVETAYAGTMAYAHRLSGGSASVAAGVSYYSQSSLDAYDVRGDPAGQFRPYDFAVSGGYVASPVDRFRVGGALKVIRSSLADVSGTTAALDFGMQALRVSQAGDGPVDIGASIRNLGPPLKLGGVSSSLPLELDGGAMWHAQPGLGVAMDLHLPVDQDPYLSFGVEAGFTHGQDMRGFVRAGYNQSRARELDPVAGFCAGVGLDLGRFRFDYAWVPAGDLGNTHRVSLGFRL